MEKVKVKFLRSHPKYGYFAGDSAELSAKEAAGLLESKHVEAVKVKAETSTPPAGETAKKADHKKKH